MQTTHTNLHATPVYDVQTFDELVSLSRAHHEDSNKRVDRVDRAPALLTCNAMPRRCTQGRSPMSCLHLEYSIQSLCLETRKFCRPMKLPRLPSQHRLIGCWTKQVGLRAPTRVSKLACGRLALLDTSRCMPQTQRHLSAGTRHAAAQSMQRVATCGQLALPSQCAHHDWNTTDAVP